MSSEPIDQADGAVSEATAPTPAQLSTFALREELRGLLAHFGGLSLDIETMVAERDQVKARISDIANQIKTAGA